MDLGIQRRLEEGFGCPNLRHFRHASRQPQESSLAGGRRLPRRQPLATVVLRRRVTAFLSVEREGSMGLKGRGVEELRHPNTDV